MKAEILITYLQAALENLYEAIQLLDDQDKERANLLSAFVRIQAEIAKLKCGTAA